MHAFQVTKEGSVPGQLRRSIVDCQCKTTTAEWAKFPLLRASSHLTSQWVARGVALYTVCSGKGKLVLSPVEAQWVVVVPSINTLKAAPGCYEACLGLSKLKLQVRCVQGSTIPIAPEVLYEFQSAPAEILSEVRRLDAMRMKRLDKLLDHRSAGNGVPDAGDDPRDGPEDNPPANPDNVPTDMEETGFKSIDDLASIGVEIKAKASSAGHRSVDIIIDPLTTSTCAAPRTAARCSSTW